MQSISKLSKVVMFNVECTKCLYAIAHNNALYIRQSGKLVHLARKLERRNQKSSGKRFTTYIRATHEVA